MERNRQPEVDPSRPVPATPEGMERYLSGTDQVLFVHARELCSGYCPIHNPSNHRMVDWLTHWRFDRGIFERICPHGTGHPDPDTLAFIRADKGGEIAGMESVHGCDGCCYEPPSS